MIKQHMNLIEWDDGSFTVILEVNDKGFKQEYPLTQENFDALIEAMRDHLFPLLPLI